MPIKQLQIHLHFGAPHHKCIIITHVSETAVTPVESSRTYKVELEVREKAPPDSLADQSVLALRAGSLLLQTERSLLLQQLHMMHAHSTSPN